MRLRPEGPELSSHAREGVGSTINCDGAPKARQWSPPLVDLSATIVENFRTYGALSR